MKPRQFKGALIQSADSEGKTLQSLLPEDGIRLMLALYERHRADGCSLDEDGDMLLYQWGIADWGDGEFFELNITRQFIEGAGHDDDDIRQLSLTFMFEPTLVMRNMKDGNRWCASPDEIKAFRQYIENSPAYKLYNTHNPTTIELEFDAV